MICIIIENNYLLSNNGSDNFNTLFVLKSVKMETQVWLSLYRAHLNRKSQYWYKEIRKKNVTVSTFYRGQFYLCIQYFDFKNWTLYLHLFFCFLFMLETSIRKLVKTGYDFKARKHNNIDYIFSRHLGPHYITIIYK